MNIKMLKAAVAGLVLCVSGFANAGLIYIETTDGELSGTVATPTLLAFTQGANTITGVIGGGGSAQGGLGWDVFSFNLTGNQSLISVIVDFYGPSGNTTGFNLFETPTNVLIQSIPFGTSDIGADILLPVMNPINTNLFRVELREFGVSQNYQLTFNVAQVPEPSTLAIFALGLMGLASRRFKKQ